ncbi:hypothetical protein KL936_003994 [Ogataea polymorpha]|nr:hypothetical protein KL936_003994 [Ogataea polymorpha]
MGSVFCPCCEPPGAVHKIPLTLQDPSLRHPLEELYFCNSCGSIKCYRCVDLEHGSKYCPSCWRSFDRESRYCQRHCFKCPSCRSRLRVKADSNNQDTKSSKSFRFNCPNCKWTYTTGSLTRPQPLYEIIREKKQSALDRRFSELKSHYENLYETLHISEARHRNRLIGKYSSLELAQVVERRKLPEIGVLREQQVDEYELPLFQELCCKTSVRCKSCREILVQPSSEPSSSSFETLSMAISRLPVLECIGSTLVITNPSAESMEIQLRLIDSSNLTLHETELYLGARPECKKPEEWAKLIPTPKLANSPAEALLHKEEGPNWKIIKADYSKTQETPVLLTAKTATARFSWWQFLKIS